MPRRWYKVLRPSLTDGLKAELSPFGRKQSILMDVPNPIIHPEEFVLPRSPRRVIGAQKLQYKQTVQVSESKVPSASVGPYEGNMYMRMLTSPLRKCILTSDLVPSGIVTFPTISPLAFLQRVSVIDFLIRVGLAGSEDISKTKTKGKGKWDGLVAIPDGLDHPRLTIRKCKKAFYIPCWRGSLDAVKEAGHQYRSVPIQPTFSEQISFQLRRRTIQEAELLGQRLMHAQNGSRLHPILRKLTKREWEGLESSGTIDEQNPIAMLCFTSPVKTTSESSAEVPSRLVSLVSRSQAGATSASIPLYDVRGLFPLLSERRSFRKALDAILGIEYKARRSKDPATEAPRPNTDKSDLAHRKDKASHVYILNGSPGALDRVDTIPLAVALWRQKMWEHGPQHWSNEISWSVDPHWNT